MRRARAGLWLPPSYRDRGELDFWPRCLKCNKAVHFYSIVDEGSHRIEILARCTHGENPRGPYRKEHFDALRLGWDGAKPDDDEMKKQISSLNFFVTTETP